MDRLRRRAPSARTTSGPPAVDVLEATVDLLRDVPWQIHVDYCAEDDGDVRLAVVAHDLGRDVTQGDEVRAGLHLETSSSGAFPTVVCERVFRVVCANGALLESEHTQAATLASADWRPALAEVVARSFSARGLDRDAARFRAATRQMLVAPYEVLCHLVARRVISDAEQAAIQREFDRAGDATQYGLINAVTRVAGRLREDDDWRRSMELERLGGEILRGDHQPPVGAFALR